MKLHIPQSADKNIGPLRVSSRINDKLQKIADKHGVTRQVAIRAILEQVIDEIEI